MLQTDNQHHSDSIYIFRNTWYLTEMRFRENLKLIFYFRFVHFRLDVI